MSSKAGASVTHLSAVRASAVAACVRLISQGVANMPLHIVDETDTGRVKKPKHPVSRLLRKAPTLDLDSAAWFEFMTANAIVYGNAYAYKVRLPGNRDRGPAELLPLLPAWVTYIRNPNGGRPTYQITTPYGLSAQVRPDDIVHLRGPVSLNDYFGDDTVDLAREAIGLSIATEETHASLHKNGVRPSGVLTTDQKLSPEAVKTLRALFQTEHGGFSRAGGVPILDSGIKFVPSVMNGVDSQHLETRRFQIQEVCRMLGVIPEMIGEGSSSAYASVEAKYAAHLQYTLKPWLKRWAGTIDRDLLRDEPELSAWWDEDEYRYAQATLAERGAYLSRLVQLGIMTRNEARRRLGEPELDGLSVPLSPGNTTQGETGRDASTSDTTVDKEPTKSVLRVVN